jgi:hypothetical protein
MVMFQPSWKAVSFGQILKKEGLGLDEEIRRRALGIAV